MSITVAITIAITVTALKLYIVQHHPHVPQLGINIELPSDFGQPPVEESRPAYVESQVRKFAYKQSICNQANRSGIHNQIIVILASVSNYALEITVHKELRWVRGNISRIYDIERKPFRFIQDQGSHAYTRVHKVLGYPSLGMF